MWGKFKKLLHRLKNLKLKKLLSDLGTAWENFLDNFLNLCGRVIFVSTVILSMFAIYIHLSNDLVGITRHFPQLPSYLKVDFFIDNYNKSLFVHSVICLFSVISIFFLRNTSLFYNKEFFRVFMFIATFGPVLSSSLVFSKLYCNTMVIYDKVDIVPYVAFVFFLYGIMLLLLSVIYY